MAQKLIVILLIIFNIFIINRSFAAEKNVFFSAAEQEPYIGSNLSEKGYVAQLVTEAYKRVGYKVKIDFFPLARAKNLAEKGEMIGYLPAIYDKAAQELFLYSDPFPGDNFVIIKKKSSKIKIKINPNSLNESLKNLSQYTFGLVRGSRDFDVIPSEKKQYSISEIQVIDKLMNDRFDLAIIDKFTAADIIVKQRPQYIGKIEVVKPPLVSNPLRIAFSKKVKGYEKFQADFNRGLKILMKNGTLDTILQNNGLYRNKINSDSKIRLTFGTIAYSQMSIMRSLSKEYEKQNPNIKVEWRVMEENTLRKRLLSDLLIEDGQFDILTIGAYEAPIWGKNNWLVPLNNLPKSYNLEDILIPIRNGLSYKNVFYALPFYGESSMLFYRKDILKKQNINISENPTYNEIFKIAKAIHDPSKKFYAICLRGLPGWGANMAFFNTLVNTTGGRWFDQNWKTTIDTPEWHRAVQIYKDLLTQYGPPEPWKNNYDENFKLFINGQCGMWIDSTVFAGNLLDPKVSKFYKQVGFTNSPVDVTKKGSHWLWIWGLSVPVSSKHRTEAQKFITWITSPEYIDLAIKKYGVLSVPPGTRNSTYKNKNYKNSAPFADFVLQSIESANPNDQSLLPVPYSGVQIIPIPEFPALGLKVGELLGEVLAEKKTIDKALKEAQSFVSNQMKESGYTK